MYRYISWNNQRRDRNSWIGIWLLLACAVNRDVWLNIEEGPVAAAGDGLYRF